MSVRRKIGGRFGWMMTFVTYGDTVETRASSRKSDCYDYDRMREPEDGIYRKKYNGLISSVDVLVGLMTVALTASLTPYLSLKYEGLENRTPELILIIFMLLGLVTMFVFANRKDTFCGRMPVEKKLPSCKGSEKILLVAGLVLFYTLSFVLDMFHLLAQIDCQSVWMACQDENIRIDAVVDILFHFIRTVYLGCSTLFVIIYGHAVFADKILVRYGLVILFGSNLAVWFDVLLLESFQGFEQNKTVADISSCVGSENWTMIFTNKTYACFHKTTRFHSLLKEPISHLCYPFMYECSVLLGERFMHWFCSCANYTKSRHSNSRKRAILATENSSNNGNPSTDQITRSRRLAAPEQGDKAAEQYDEDPNLSRQDYDIEKSDDNDEGFVISDIDDDDCFDESSDFSDESEGLGDNDVDSIINVPFHENDSNSFSDEIGNQQRVTEIMSRTESRLAEYDTTPNNSQHQATTFANNYVSLARQTCNNEVDNSSRFVGESAAVVSNFIQSTPIEDDVDEDSPSNMTMYALFFLTTISTNVVFFVFSLLPAVFINTKDFSTVSHCFLIYSTVYYIVVLFVVIAGFIVARNFPTRRSGASFQGLDYLLLISAAGPFAYNIVSLIVIWFEPSDITGSGLNVWTSLLLQFSNLFEVYSQIPFCFFSGRVTALNENGTRRPGAKYFQAVLIYLSVCNATLWLINSFATTFNGVNVYYGRYIFGGVWSILNSIALPATLFFRFNSFLLLLKALRLAFKTPRSSRASNSRRVVAYHNN